MDAPPQFTAGENIAMKVSAVDFEATVAFYRDVLAFPVAEDRGDKSVVFEFGGKKLWVDSVEDLDKAEIWLEVVTGDVESAESFLESQGISRAEGIEDLPEGLKAFWIRNPAGVVHLVSEE